jgi:hypothetical protein
MFSRSNSELTLAADDPHLQGAMFDFWGYAATLDAFERVTAAMPVVGEKLWNDVSDSVPYPTFANRCCQAAASSTSVLRP